jgi:transcriptional regulator with XRE-family HTH domain
MKERIAEVRKSAGLSQAEMADRLGLSRNFISLMENGNRIPSDRTVADICREFGVNRIWLETGVGEPFQPKDKREELKAIFADVLSGRPSEKNAFIEAVAQLPDNVFPVLVKSWIASAEEMKRKLKTE